MLATAKAFIGFNIPSMPHFLFAVNASLLEIGENICLGWEAFSIFAYYHKILTFDVSNAIR
jgi:hypothetical protein